MLTAEQLEQRRLGIGGSDVAPILGLSPWRTPLDVYYEKTGEVELPPVDDGPDTPIYWGNILEDLVAEEYVRRTGHKVRRRRDPVVHPEVNIARANLDRVVVSHPDGPGVLECKTARAKTDGWGEPGTDEVPDYYLTQVHHYLAVTGYAWADLAVLFMGDRQFAIYRIRRDDGLVRHLLDTERAWWNDHVARRVPPPPMTAEDMARAWPVDSGSQVIATEFVEAACRQLADVKGEIKRLDDQKADLEMMIKREIGDASALVAPDGRALATWKKAKDSTSVDWHSACADLAEYVPDEIFERITEAHTNTNPGARRFLLKIKPENKS